MKELTKAEEDVMKILWKLEKAFVKDIVEKFIEPRPAYNTVSTIVRILEKKGFIDHEAFGKTHQYFPAVSKEQYRTKISKSLLSNYFGGSVKNLVSHFAQENSMDLKELNEILELIQNKKEKK